MQKHSTFIEKHFVARMFPYRLLHQVIRAKSAPVLPSKWPNWLLGSHTSLRGWWRSNMLKCCEMWYNQLWYIEIIPHHSVPMYHNWLYHLYHLYFPFILWILKYIGLNDEICGPSLFIASYSKILVVVQDRRLLLRFLRCWIFWQQCARLPSGNLT